MEEKGSIRRSYIRICAVIMVILLTLAGVAEFTVRRKNNDSIKLYKIEIERTVRELEAHTDDPSYEVDTSKYDTITGVFRYDGEEDSFFETNSHCAIRDIDGQLYRIEYKVDVSQARKTALTITHIALAVMLLTALALMVWFYVSLIRTFSKISDYPKELSKGHLTIPLKENRNKYFGQFLWGLDMLREKLEEEERMNLELQKERNMFLLSLSHDIKTPISAIKLYSAAIRKGLYKDADKLTDVASKIDSDAEEIEAYVSKVITSSKDDFLEFNVTDGECYLSTVIDHIREYYSDKLDQIGTEHMIGDYSDILIKGDPDRLIEVFQNIYENAIKYGDGAYIKMSFADEEESRLVTVENSGCTLPEGEFDHIFDSFFRGSNVGNRAGSGLGLYICRKLMNKMGGDIYAESEGGVMKVTVVLSRR